MGVVFTESRSLPPELRRMGHFRRYGDLTANTHVNMNAETAIADVFRSLTTGAVDWFGGTTSEAKIAAANAAAAQAQYGASQAYAEEDTKRTLIYVGAGLVGLVVLASIVKAASRPIKIKNKVGGYRRRKRSRR
jgi:hypothetical protein